MTNYSIGKQLVHVLILEIYAYLVNCLKLDGVTRTTIYSTEIKRPLVQRYDR